MRFLNSASGGLEQPMLPTQPPTANVPALASKRKNADDANLLGNIAKRARNEQADRSSVQAMGARVEKKGNFVITRKASAPPQSSQTADRDTHEARATHPGTAGASSTAATAGPSVSLSSQKPSSSTLRADPAFARVRKKGKGRDVPPGTAVDNEVEEDVRQMNTEADGLRDRSRASIASMTPAAMTVELEFPPPKTSHNDTGKSHLPQLKDRFGSDQIGHDGTIPIADQETPQIVRNRLFRGESRPPNANAQQSRNAPSNGPSYNTAQGLPRRRSSFSMRGKRISSTFESTGIITMPHTSVSDTSLYKHIDPELPESQRIRQLLIWAASRAKDPSSRRGGKGKTNVIQPPPDVNLPTLPPGGAELLQEVEDDVIRLLAEKKIDTSVYSGPSGVNGTWKLKENEQNVKNRAREKLFTKQIEERKKEDLAWAEVAQFYNAHQANVLSTISQKNRASKGKGKQRATSQEPEDLEPWENELPEAFRGSKGYDIAKHLVELGIEGVGKGDHRLEQLQLKEDLLHTVLSVARQLAHTTRQDLDRRFALLNISLAQRTLPPSSEAVLSSQQALSNFVPVNALPSSRHAGPDAQDLLRALTRTDAARPRGQVGDAARRAAKDVQRARESQVYQSAESGTVSAQERKLTDVPPPTPRKPPGTPKRAGTPGASRR